MSDCFHSFFEHFESGDLLAAIDQIVPTPQICYDQLFSEESLFPHLVNFVDAAVFGTFSEARIAILCLHSFLEKDKKFALRYPKSLSRLKFEEKVLEAAIDRQRLAGDSLPSAYFRFLLSEHEKELLSGTEVQKILSQAPEFYRKSLEKQIALSQGWIDFQKRKSDQALLYAKEKLYFSHPWYPLRYSLELPHFSINSSQVPLLFLEPIKADYSWLLTRLKNRPVLFVFETRAAFLQMLQFSEVRESFCDPHHLIYLLDLYPHEQFVLQDRSLLKGLSLQPMAFAKKKHIEPMLPVLTQAIMECITQSDEELKRDSEMGNWLYHIGKKLLLAIQGERLGINRAAALFERINNENWRDPHKGLPPKEKKLGPEPIDYLQIKLSQLAQKSYLRNRKLRLAHIVPQIVDGGHAPSRLLENLIRYHNPDRFELFIFSTERMQFHPLEYPYNLYASPSSEARAPQRLNYFQSLGVKIHIQNNRLTYEKCAETIALLLHQVNADIAVFHGPDVINLMCAQLTDTKLKVLFEHGSQPAYSGFDLVIVSSQGALEIYQDLFAKLHVKAQALPFNLDVRAQWLPDPFPKAKLGLPEDSLAMTTISNHLNHRLSHEMCLAIAEILKRIPKAYFVPIGPISQESQDKFHRFFLEHHVKDRVIFLGAVANPSQYARSMHLYLNEFPFGSCLGMLDAMASGCPVVSMYDRHGPQQARYGGDYFGIDRAVTSCQREDYVELACQLLTNPEMYAEWSEHAKKQYAKQADVAAYVKAFETIILYRT